MFNILIVEDEVIQRQNLVSIVSELGASYNILEAGNVKKIVESVNGEIQLSNSDGFVQFEATFLE